MAKAVENDPAFKSAKEAFEKAKNDIVSARREAGKEARQMVGARQKFTRVQQNLQQKINADFKDDNKPKNKIRR